MLPNNQSDALVRREEFAISLRKQKRTQILKAKRQRIVGKYDPGLKIAIEDGNWESITHQAFINVANLENDPELLAKFIEMCKNSPTNSL